jgi:hypothetical protein
MEVSNTMVQTNVVTSKQRFQSRVNKPWKGGWNIPSKDKKYPLKRDSKSTKQRSIIKIYCKNMQKHHKELCFQLIEDIIVLY